MIEPSATRRVLVAVASYGRAQDHFLAQLLAQLKRLSLPVRIVVLSDQGKPVPDGVEVLAGLPSRNPYSLPFAHRRLFADNLEHFDLFIYTEDDMLLTPRHVESFLEVQASLASDEIAGFVRSETAPDGQVFITSIHHHFRWRPESVVDRGGHRFAFMTNLHSGCFIIGREQLRRAIASGGFLVAPHQHRYGMLETAASDVYSQCGLRRLLCVSRIGDFIIPHLPNKYYKRMGIPLADLEAQASTLCKLGDGEDWRGSLFEPETRAPGFRWSKLLHEASDADVLRAVPPGGRTVLSVGAARGENEAWLVGRGHEVCAVPLDAIFAAQLNGRGIRTVQGPLDRALESLGDETFDTVLLADVLHLVEDPLGWLALCRQRMKPGGCLVASLPHTSGWRTWLHDLQLGRCRWRRPVFKSFGVQPVTPHRVREWIQRAGLRLVELEALPRTGPVRAPVWGSTWFQEFCSAQLVIRAVPRG